MSKDKAEPLASEALSKAIKLLLEADKRYATHYSLVNEADKEIGDLLHELELYEHNRDELAKLARELRDCRRKRRYYKDMVEILQPLVDFMSDTQSRQFLGKLSRALGKMRQAENYHAKRTYIPRVRTDTKQAKEVQDDRMESEP